MSNGDSETGTNPDERQTCCSDRLCRYVTRTVLATAAVSIVTFTGTFFAAQSNEKNVDDSLLIAILTAVGAGVVCLLVGTAMYYLLSADDLALAPDPMSGRDDYESVGSRSLVTVDGADSGSDSDDVIRAKTVSPTARTPLLA